MTYELLKNFIDSMGLKQVKLSNLLLERYPKSNFTKNKLSNILLGKVELTVDDFQKILTVLKNLFPNVTANDFFNLDYCSSDEEKEE